MSRRWLVARCAIALLMIPIGVAVALWPRGDRDTRPSDTAAVSPSPTAVDLTAARAKARLRPCPAPVPGGEGPIALRGVRASCLGDGTTVDLGAALAGRTTLINVWAPWCQPCRNELPVLDAYAVSPGAAPVLGVQILSEPADGLELLAALGVRFPSVYDVDDTVIKALRAPAYLPVSYLVTGDGSVRQVLPPTAFQSVEEIERAVRGVR